MCLPVVDIDSFLAGEAVLYGTTTTAHSAVGLAARFTLAVFVLLAAAVSSSAQSPLEIAAEPDRLLMLQEPYQLPTTEAEATLAKWMDDDVGEPSVPNRPPGEAEPAAYFSSAESADEGPTISDLAKMLMPLSSDDGNITFTPGLRIQPRYNYEETNDNNDFFIRRFRLKGSGNAYDIAKYGVELKIDNTSRFEATPSASVENAWLDFPVLTNYAYLRVGLYDIPFSRNALTSDSKLLLMDRTLIKEAITALGMADNTVGLMLHGRPYCGRFEYAVGIFDNVVFEKLGATGTRESDELMPAGRFVFYLLDPATPPDGYADYKESYIGEGNRLEIGFNGAHLGEVIDGPATFDLTALGTDLFFGSGPYSFQAEFDWFVENLAAGADISGHGWYVQGGYLLSYSRPWELVALYQVLDSDIIADTVRWTSVGVNRYIRGHNLKIQTDYTFRDGGVLDDAFQVQLQLDF